jgi:hypothetical protein
MKADLTRNTFDPQKRFLRVLMQQGRVQLDADFNEQVSILLHYMKALATDLIGPHGGPEDGCGFKIISSQTDLPDDLPEEEKELLKRQLGKLDSGDFLISKGRYYVDGMLCENEYYVSYTGQPNLPNPENLETDDPCLVFLDVWERHITAIEDGGIREVALGGADTATRSALVWQVKVLQLDLLDLQGETIPDCDDLLHAKLGDLRRPGRGELSARLHPAQVSDDHCIIPPGSRYRGTENQLYRVEIHRPGAVSREKDESDARNQRETAYYSQGGATTGDVATFKWSRDNGSVAFPIVGLSGNRAEVELLGKDSRRTLERDDWVEIMDDHLALQGLHGQLFQVDEVDPLEQIVTLRVPQSTDSPISYQKNSNRHPLLRRWDSPGEVPIPEDTKDGWIPLEDGIEVRFEGDGFQTGDYWLIPARTATGDIQWPHKEVNSPNGQREPKMVSPHGITHYYAPLAIVSTGSTEPVEDCRCKFVPLCE